MKLKFIFTIAAVVMAVFIFDSLTNAGHSNSAGAPAGRTGSPGDGGNTCAAGACHSGNAVTPATGWITSNIPAQGYIGGTTYTITATATYTGRVKFGFEVACQNGITNAMQGTIINTSTQSQMNGNYITHTSTGTSGPGGSKTWTFNWKAPIAGTGNVTFYGAFNCTNSNNLSSGDLIYTSTLPVSEFSISGVDAGVTGFTAPLANNCTNSITPVVKVKNFGSVTMTSCTVSYVIDNGTPVPFTWNGSLATGAISSVTLPYSSVSAGLHSIKAYTSNPNGGADASALDDTSTTYFSANGSAVPFTEGFESTTFPPNGWTIVNPDNSITWDRSTSAHHSGTACAHVNDYSYNAAGQVDDMISPNIDISNVDSPRLSFYVAYAMYTGNAPETLSVYISTDCGSTWTSIYAKNGTALQTAPAETTLFVPTISQWRKDSISLSPYTSFSNLIFKFSNTTEYGNDLYLDDINIAGLNTGIPTIEKNLFNVNVFPNPANNKLNVGFSLSKHETVNIRLYDIYGKLIETILNDSKPQGDYTLSFDVNKYAAGLYFLNLSAGESTTVKKVFIQ